MRRLFNISARLVHLTSLQAARSCPSFCSFALLHVRRRRRRSGGNMIKILPAHSRIFYCSYLKNIKRACARHCAWLRRLLSVTSVAYNVIPAEFVASWPYCLPWCKSSRSHDDKSRKYANICPSASCLPYISFPRRRNSRLMPMSLRFISYVKCFRDTRALLASTSSCWLTCVV